ncbi:MAG: GDSL-type esterase/lipase family protein [Lachnospiraceae bacterium]|nr:GDSL-type esterase/lipase family protein [Lachnospiraceae bacterium]
MKKFRKAPLLWLILISFVILTVVSGFEMAEEGRKKELNMVKEPLLTVVLQELSEGVLPFHLERYLVSDSTKVSAPVGEDTDDDKITVNDDGTLSMNELEPEESVSENMALERYEYRQVGRAYFDDAVFIGDSRTDGLAKYSGLDNATFYAKNSLTIYDFFTKRFIPVEGETEKLTLEEVMQQKQFAKIYIMFGINELGTGSPQRFGAEYLRVLTRIRELQPDAILFVQGMMRVTAAKSTTDPIYNNVNINMRNALLATVDNHHDVFYLEMNDAVCDENGDLDAEYTFDDVHLKARYYNLWVDYLMSHGI